MKKSSFILLAFSICVSTFTISCRKETGCTNPKALNYTVTADIDDGSCVFGGCIDPDSKNYDPFADVDNGSCTYAGSIVFWYGDNVAAKLVVNGITSLTYYFDGELVGSSASSVFWTGAPVCGQTGSITVNKELGFYKSLPYTFSVRDQNNYDIWGGVTTIEAIKK